MNDLLECVRLESDIAIKPVRQIDQLGYELLSDLVACFAGRDYVAMCECDYSEVSLSIPLPEYILQKSVIAPIIRVYPDKSIWITWSDGKHDVFNSGIVIRNNGKPYGVTE